MTGPDPERLAVWRDFLQAHARLLDVLGSELEERCGLPLTWYDVLLNLHQAGGALRMHDLASAVLLSRSGLTRLVDRMVAAGLVERKACAEDRRGLLAVVTPAGVAALRAAAPVHLAGIEEHFARHLDEAEVAALATALPKIAGAHRRACVPD